VFSAPVLCVPLVPIAFDQSTLAAHDTASVELHVRVDGLPTATEVGLAVIATPGAFRSTVSSTDADIRSPALFLHSMP
jgi:hypothetical protein